MASESGQQDVTLPRSLSSQVSDLSINVRQVEQKVDTDSDESSSEPEVNMLHGDVKGDMASSDASSPLNVDGMSSPDEMQTMDKDDHSSVLPTHLKEKQAHEKKRFLFTCNSYVYEDYVSDDSDINPDRPNLTGKENMTYEEVLRKFYQVVDDGSPETIQDVVYKYNIDVSIIFSSTLPFVKRKHRGWTAVHIAASHGNVRAIRFLLAEGADIEAVTPEGETALHMAAKHGAAEVVSYLLECNIFLRDRQNNQGVTALLKAIFNIQHAFKGNYRRCVDLLLGAGCNPNISSSSKVTALHVAVDKGDLQLVTKLISSGANVNAVCDRNTSPLIRALISKFVNTQIVTALLLAGADTTWKMNGRSSLHIAVSRCDDRIIETFIQNGADPNCQDLIGKTPLWAAVEENNITVVPILVAGGGNINYVREPQCISLLSQAVINNSLPMVKLLLDLGASVHTETFMWSTPLHLAVDQQHLGIIMELLRANCSLNSTSNAKYSLRPMTPVQLAMELGNVEIICLLIQAGCKVKWSWLKEDRLSLALSSKPDAIRHINKYISQIPSLLHLSRLSIREYLGDRFKTALKYLTETGTIPQKISSYLDLSDILD